MAGVNRERWEKVAQLKSGGMSTGKIAEVLGVTPKAISQTLQNRSVKDRIAEITKATMDSVYSSRDRLAHDLYDVITTIALDKGESSAVRLNAAKTGLGLLGFTESSAERRLEGKSGGPVLVLDNLTPDEIRELLKTEEAEDV